MAGLRPLDHQRNRGSGLWNEEGGRHGRGVFGGYLPARLTSDGDWTPLLYTFIAVLSFSALILTPLWNKAG